MKPDEKGVKRWTVSQKTDHPRHNQSYHTEVLEAGGSPLDNLVESWMNMYGIR